MPTQMIVRVDTALKERLSRLARTEGKSTSRIVRELIEDYVSEHDIAPYIDGLWDRVGAKLRSKGVTPASVDKAIREARRARR